MQTGELKNIINELLGIQFNIEKARLDGKVQNLASYINEKTLIAGHKQMEARKAKGIDGVAKEDYSVNLEANVKHLVKRMKSGSYKPEPIRRVYIPKDDSSKMRPLGISCYEDKLVENIMAQILAMVYEPKFYKESFGLKTKQELSSSGQGNHRRCAIPQGKLHCGSRYKRFL